MLTRQQQHNLLLRIVRVLVLVHQHILEALHVLLPDVLMVAQQHERLHQQVVEVHGIGLAAALNIAVVDLAHLRALAADVVLGPVAGGILRRQQQVVLGHRDAVGDAVGLVHLVVELHLLDDALHQRAGISLVVDGEVGVEADVLGLSPQDAGKHRVEGAHLQPGGTVLPHQAPYAFLHLAGSLVGKRQRQDIPRCHAPLQQVGNLIGQHTRLSRPCTGYHQLWPVAVFHGLPLAIVQFIQ